MSENDKPKGPIIMMADPNSTSADQLQSLNKKEKRPGLRMGSERSGLENMLTAQLSPGSFERLAFEQDPSAHNSYAAIYQAKLKLIPDHILKRIAIQDDLVACITQTRGNQLQTFGRPQPDRFSLGFKLVVDKSREMKMDTEERKKLQERIDAVQKKLITCGEVEGWDVCDQMTFPTFLGLITRNGITVGRLAVEAILSEDAQGQKKFHSFRPVDAGTIYRATPFKEHQQRVREQAVRLLEQIKNKRLEQAKFEADEYQWVQVINGKPVQAFTEHELYVHTLYPVLDVELEGYPVTPIDAAISAITTHVNITTYNRLYFQSGRAAKGMLVINSEDIDEHVITRFKHQFQASINNVANSHRTPVFAIGKDDKIEWMATDSGGKDMEFQYLSDTNARTIMSAYQISPEELPGYQHLSRGTNNQALSEGNNEYKLEAARDVGIRPLMSQIEDFLNQRIMPLLDEKLAELVTLKFVGMDAETRDKEAARLGEESQLVGTYDDLLTQTEKKPVGPDLGGTLPLNPAFSQKMDAYLPVGVIEEKWMGHVGAAKDENLQYRRDPFWFQWQQLQMQKQQMAMEQQAQQQQAAAQAGQQPGQPGQPQQGDPNAQPQQDPNAQPQEQGGDLSSGIDQVLAMLTKSEEQLPSKNRRLLQQQRQTVARLMSTMEADLAKLSDDIMDVADRALPDKHKK